MMPAKKARKKTKPKKKAKKTRKMKKTKKAKKARKAVKRPAARKVARRVTAAKPMRPVGPHYSCILCGVEVAITKSGLGISRLMCCGQPMTRR
jgi:hypothetical protein